MNQIRTGILEKLRNSGPGFVSGRSLGAAFGVSRAAVWKHIKRLRELGYRIEARPNRGYRLHGLPDLLDRPRLNRPGMLYLESVDSTNRRARLMAEEGALNFFTVIAEEQEQGRGRLGRSWSSLPGCGLWFSMVVRPTAMTPAETAPVTLAAAASVASFLTGRYRLPVRVKWPNDLLIDGKKFGGILTESKAVEDRVDYLVLGIGMNINHTGDDFSQALKKTATSLRIATGKSYNRTDLFLALHEKLLEDLKQFIAGGFTAFKQAWKNHSATLGQEVTVGWAGGEINGLALDITDEGALVVRNSAGRNHLLRYGEIKRNED